MVEEQQSPTSPLTGESPVTTIDSDGIANAVNSNGTSHNIPVEAETLEIREARLARAFLDDLVVTSLLRLGRALSYAEISGAAEGAAPGRSALRRALAEDSRLEIRERDYELALRVEAEAEPRAERTRRPIAATVETLLRSLGKPLPLPVIVREVATLRGVLPETVRDACGQIVPTLRAAVATAPASGPANTWIHRDFVLDTGAPREDVLVRENQLDSDPDFIALSNRDWAASASTGSLAERVTALLDAVGYPISQKLLGFLLWRQLGPAFSSEELARVLGDRNNFYSLTGGLVTTQAQVPALREQVRRWVSSENGSAVQNLDVAGLLRQRIAPSEVLAPQPAEIEELVRSARATKAPISLVDALIDVMEIEPDDPQFVRMLQGLNDALRRDSAWLPVGLGRFLLREMLPAEVGEIPQALRPIQLSIRDTETNELLDIEMSDDGLEGDCVEFIHAPQWEDVGEEVEVKMARRTGEEDESSMRYVVLYPHYRSGTLKLRRADEDFFDISGPISRINVVARDEEGTENIGAWASRDSGLIYGLGDWYRTRLPQSGGVLNFTRNPNGQYSLEFGKPDKLMSLDETRIAELEELQERSGYLSLLDLLQTVIGGHSGGAELATLWAEINVVRRTSKRLMCSVLSGYQCFSFKQRGPKQILWRFDASKMDAGFKKNKRKFVRR